MKTINFRAIGMTLPSLTSLSVKSAMMTTMAASVMMSVMITGCSSNSVSTESVQSVSESERLGTTWGDEVSSKVTVVDLQRTSDDPIEQMQLYYADKDYTGREINNISLLAGKVSFSVTSDQKHLPMYRDAGNYYLKGQSGQAYQLVYRNNSDNTYEVVTSVDGLNVLDGNAASRYDQGYVLNPHEDLVIEGFRKSQDAVASFIFGAPENAYAANTTSGDINNTGIIGTVFYELYDPKLSNNVAHRQPQAFPADDGYAKPPSQ